MRLIPLLATAASILSTTTQAAEDRIIESSSLVPCMKNSNFYASLFRVVFTPQNRTLTYEINGESTVSSYVVLDLQVQAYGYPALRKKIDPCSGTDLKGLCPMTTGSLANMRSNLILEKDTMKQIPGVVYYIPDIDGKVRVWINSTETGNPLACVEAEIRNGKTVHHQAISWILAIITGLCLVVSAFMSGFGHFMTAAHVSARALALISYFQAQASIGMLNNPYPPIVRAWTQNFQWSMGIIKAHSLEAFATWYQRSTGGRPARLFYSLFTTSVHLQRRSNDQGQIHPIEVKTVSGMERVAFMAHIESTNIFVTGYFVFVAVLVLVTISVAAFKGICEFFVRRRWMNENRFIGFRSEWTLTLKGIILRLILMGSLPIIVLSFYELTRKDSAAEVILAIWMFIFVVVILTFAYIKVWRIVKRSEQVHHSSAYLLYSDSKVLNKWGFLYIQYKANMTSYLILSLAHSILVGAFVGLGQKNGKAQIIGLFILEALLLGLISWSKPYMDKPTNAFIISIASVNSVNLFILLLISGMVKMPALGVGVLGVIFFLLNTIFAAVIILMTIYTAIHAISRRNPDVSLPGISDDRNSFMKSQNNSQIDELKALSRTARGEPGLKHHPSVSETLAPASSRSGSRTMASFSTDHGSRDVERGSSGKFRQMSRSTLSRAEKSEHV